MHGLCKRWLFDINLFSFLFSNIETFKSQCEAKSVFFSFCDVHVVVWSYYLVGYISKQREVPKILRKV